MTFISGNLCHLKVLQESEHEVKTWTDAVMSGLTTQHLFTGSYPMRYIDVKEQWKKEREAGDILLGIWTDKFVGTCGLHQHREVYRSWEARFLIFDADAVGKGIGKEVSKLLVEYGFDRLNSMRLWLGVSADNLRAVKAYLDTGWRVEGRQRMELFYHGAYHDTYRMAILRDEYEKMQQMPH